MMYLIIQQQMWVWDCADPMVFVGPMLVQTGQGLGSGMYISHVVFSIVFCIIFFWGGVLFLKEENVRIFSSLGSSF